jgi:MHS family shikimate/dehydroshikimate transporter-like MFS transporter
VIRLHRGESPVFHEVKETKAESDMPIVEAFRDYKKEIFLIAGMRLAILTTFYGATVFALGYGDKELGIPRGQLLGAILVTAALGFVSKPIFGHWSDKVGRRPIYMWGSITGALAAVPFFLALESGSFLLILVAYFVIINISHDLNDAVESSFFSELFGARVRYTGAAMGHQLGAALGGFTPLIAGGLAAAAGNHWYPVAIYVTVACIISAVCVSLSAETSRKDLTEDLRRDSAVMAPAMVLRPSQEPVPAPVG